MVWCTYKQTPPPLRPSLWKDKFASVYQSTLAWYGQVWCFCDESPKFHGRRNKFRGCPCTRVHQSRMTKQFTRALMLLGGRVTVPRSRNFSDCWTRVRQSRMTKQFTRAQMLLGGRVTVPRSRTADAEWLLRAPGARQGGYRRLVIREVPRSANYEYEYVWVSRILTRWLSVPRRSRSSQNEYEYEYNIVGRVKLAVDLPRPLSRTLRVCRPTSVTQHANFVTVKHKWQNTSALIHHVCRNLIRTLLCRPITYDMILLSPSYF